MTLRLDRVAFQCDNSTLLRYQDQRKFGNIEYFLTKEDLDDSLKGLGPDIIRDDITLENFTELMKSVGGKKPSKKLVCAVLLDQSVVAGIGNYMRSDILYQSEISPYTEIGQLSDKQIEKLYEACIHVARTSAKLRGFTMDTITPTGIKGEYYPSAYGKVETTSGKPFTKSKIQGRAVYWCEEVQK